MIVGATYEYVHCAPLYAIDFVSTTFYDVID